MKPQDEEIKKSLEEFQNRILKTNLSYHIFESEMMAVANALDLISRQQERIEELEIITGLANNRKYYRKFVDEVFCKQKGNELSEPDFDYIYQLYFEQQAEIERLKNEIKGFDKFLKETDCSLKEIRAEAIKEFAERLKEKQRTFVGDELAYKYIPSIEIDVLLLEMVGG